MRYLTAVLYLPDPRTFVHASKKLKVEKREVNEMAGEINHGSFLWY